MKMRRGLTALLAGTILANALGGCAATSDKKGSLEDRLSPDQTAMVAQPSFDYSQAREFLSSMPSYEDDLMIDDYTTSVSNEEFIDPDYVLDMNKRRARQLAPTPSSDDPLTSFYLPDRADYSDSLVDRVNMAIDDLDVLKTEQLALHYMGVQKRSGLPQKVSLGDQVIELTSEQFKESVDDLYTDLVDHTETCLEIAESALDNYQVVDLSGASEEDKQVAEDLYEEMARYALLSAATLLNHAYASANAGALSKQDAEAVYDRVLEIRYSQTVAGALDCLKERQDISEADIYFLDTYDMIPFRVNLARGRLKLLYPKE